MNRLVQFNGCNGEKFSGELVRLTTNFQVFQLAHLQPNSLRWKGAKIFRNPSLKKVVCMSGMDGKSFRSCWSIPMDSRSIHFRRRCQDEAKSEINISHANFVFVLKAEITLPRSYHFWWLQSWDDSALKLPRFCLSIVETKNLSARCKPGGEVWSCWQQKHMIQPITVCLKGLQPYTGVSLYSSLTFGGEEL